MLVASRTIKSVELSTVIYSLETLACRTSLVVGHLIGRNDRDDMNAGAAGAEAWKHTGSIICIQSFS